MSIRPAVDADLLPVVEVFLACWTTTYGRDLPPELMERVTPESAREMWTRAWSDPALSKAVAVDHDRPVGVVSFAVREEGEGYLASLYVDPRVQGSGSGRALLAHAERELAERGVTRCRLWVFEANEPSRRFYRNAGWTPDGSRTVLPEWGQPQVRLSKDLS